MYEIYLRGWFLFYVTWNFLSSPARTVLTSTFEVLRQEVHTTTPAPLLLSKLLLSVLDVGKFLFTFSSIFL